MQSKNAPCGRPVDGALAPSTLITTAPLLITPTVPVAALSTLDTPTLGATALPPQLVYSTMSWSWHTLTLSGIMLTPAMRDLMSSCMVATFWEGHDVIFLGTWPYFSFIFLPFSFFPNQYVLIGSPDPAFLPGTLLFPHFGCLIVLFFRQVCDLYCS